MQIVGSGLVCLSLSLPLGCQSKKTNEVEKSFAMGGDEGSGKGASLAEPL